jgi:ABC-2 type transport system permease protein
MRPPDAVAPPRVDHVMRPPGPADSTLEPPHLPTPPRPPSQGPLATWRKYQRIFRASLVERMAYRGDFLLGTVMRFLPMVTTILLWQAIYAGSGRSDLDGFKYREMIAYLLLTHISRMFSSMPGLAAGIARDIREGTLKRYLIQPLDLIGYLVSYRVAHKVAYIVTSAVPYGLLFFVCRNYFDGLPDATTMAAYFVSLVLAFLVGFFFEASVGMVGFWFLEVTSLLYIVMTLTFFISGQLIPLDLLPAPWAGLLKVLPFQYMAYFPAVVFLGKIKGRELALHLLGELAWALVFMVLARVLYRLGLRRYSAYGG